MGGRRSAALVAAALMAGAGQARATSSCHIARIAELPVQMQGFRPLVTLQINGEPATFTLDSGAFFSMISPGYATHLGLPMHPAPFGFTVRGVGGTATVSIAVVKQFGISGAALRDVEFLAGGTEIESGIGVIGQNILGFADVEYDLPDGDVRLFKPSGCARGAFAYWSQAGHFSVPIKAMDQIDRHTTATVYVNGVAVTATFDTGAPKTVLSLRAAARIGIHPGDPGVRPDGDNAGIGRHVGAAWSASFRTLDIGDEDISNPRLRIADLGDTDMLIGADFFVSHRMYVSNAEHRIDFTYTGGRIFDTGAHADGALASAGIAAADSEPGDADGFSRRATMELTQHRVPQALADLDKAVTLAPGEPRYRLERARARIAAGDRAGARDDLDAAITAAPTDSEARMMRAAMRAADDDRAGALTDLDAAAAHAPATTNARLELGGLYVDADAPDRAIGQYDQWIASHPDDARRIVALNDRCWAKALADTDLDRALADCNAAVRAAPKAAGFLDSRGLVELRLGRDARALADYDAALAMNPRMAWSLYGRGIVESRSGETAKAEADMAAARAIAPHIAERAKRFGL